MIRGHTGTPDGRSAATLEVHVWIGAAIAILLLLVGRLWWLPARAPLNVNEGWNAGQALRAWGAGPLYPDPEALIANNYPPLSFYLVGAAGRLTGDAIIAGRLLSLAAQIATGAAIWTVVVRLASRRWAVAGALLFAGFAATLLRPYVAMNDPQWLGHAAMSWALVMLIPPEADKRLSTGRIVAAALLMLAGGLIKHNIIAIPIAATLWLWLADRRAFSLWMAAGVLIATSACMLLFALWGTAVFIDILAPARSYSLVRTMAKGGPLLLALSPALLACRPLLTAWRRDVRLALPAILLGVAVPIGIVQRAGDGVDVNAFFEAIIAVSIAVPVACRLRQKAGHAWAAISALPILCLAPAAAAKSVAELGGRDAAVRQWQPFIARIAAAPGPVACDDQAVCYWAGRESELDFFSIKQRLLHHRGRALHSALAGGRFAMIQMRGENPGWHENLLIPAIRARYRTVYTHDGIELLIPRVRDTVRQGSAADRRCRAAPPYCRARNSTRPERGAPPDHREIFPSTR
jgi:hypothetical protein